MYKKKEIIIIVIIILITIFLAFLPKIIDSNKKEEDVTIDSNNQIEIKIKGEIKVKELVINVPKGSSYGYIISKIKLYLNDYSIIDSNMTNRYYEDSIIIIESLDIKEEVKESIEGKININEASYSELITLYGIGDKRANKIIEYRKTNKIDSFETLKKIIGVSNEVIEAIKEKAFL